MLTNPRTIAATSLLALAACSGSSGGGDTGNSAAADFFTNGPDVVTINGGIASGDGTETVNGNLNRADQSLDFGDFSGNISSDGSAVSNDTTTWTIADDDTEYVRVYTDGVRSGFFGVATPVADVPGGTASYSGNGDLVLIDDTGIYELSGDATTSVDFGAGTVNTTIAGLNGTLDTGAAAVQDLSDAGTLSLNDMQIVQNGFNGGSINIDSTVITSEPTSLASEGIIGNFFGPNGEEVGGAFQRDDREDGEQLLFGTFSGQ